MPFAICQEEFDFSSNTLCVGRDCFTPLRGVRNDGVVIELIYYIWGLFIAIFLLYYYDIIYAISISYKMAVVKSLKRISYYSRRLSWIFKRGRLWRDCFTRLRRVRNDGVVIELIYYRFSCPQQKSWVLRTPVI